MCCKAEPVRARLSKLLAEHFVRCNATVRWCPGADCACAVRYTTPVQADRGPYPVACTSCGEHLCFACGKDDHTPAPCAMLDTWAKFCALHSDATSWIVQNTKDCPKCKNTIHKDGGCNSMRCRCGHEFCWICGEVHGQLSTL